VLPFYVNLVEVYISSQVEAERKLGSERELGCSFYPIIIKPSVSLADVK
jgi:hypothetical protein